MEERALCTRCFEAAEGERRCAWCGKDVPLCEEHRERTFLCELCFRNKNEVGDKAAKLRARWRERARRRRARERNKRKPDPFPLEQETLWGRDVLLSLPVPEPPPP